MTANAFGADNDPTTAPESTTPDLEFLEFLGQFETDEGQWIDPDSLLADEFLPLLGAAEPSPPATDNTNQDDDQ